MENEHVVIVTSKFSSPIGELLIATIDGSVVWLQIGDANNFDLLERYITANISDPYTLAKEGIPVNVAEQLQSYFDGKLNVFSLPINPMGTPFQKQVWDEVSQIPYGITATYASVAERIGNKNAVRAVGAANGSNPLPIIIPCHRVVGANGNLTGYGYGIEAKKALLVHEGALLA